MAPTRTNGTSRAATARVSRAGSTARDIVKKREKPYKTENKRVLAKKRKLDLHTSYYHKAPTGFAFLPLGTPELAERCKELSRLGGYAVNVVNAKPVSRYAHNPEKVSHHIARVGYHFRVEVLEQAVEELDYIHVQGHWIKRVDLERERHAAAEKGAYARILAQYGVDINALSRDAQRQRETPEKVSAAIKELFPKIPDQDLKEIVRHAWAEGSDRVGTNNNMDLPRRVQLATIARIRHTYTDYDRLLRAFEWKEARSLVEPECLHKLIEWRGENDDDADDNDLEEIVRETIVIDDDDEGAGGHESEADDEDSVTEVEPGDTSDTSIEITHHVAADQDLGAETSDERSRRLLNRLRPQPRAGDARMATTKQKISAAREKMRAGVPPPQRMLPVQQVRSVGANGDIRYGLPPTQNGQPPAEVVVDGRRLRLIPEGVAQPSPREYGYQPTMHLEPYRQQNAFDGGRMTARPSPYTGPAAMHDRPVASIERDEGRPQLGNPHVGVHGLRPVTPDSSRGLKRRRMEDLGAGRPTPVQHAIPDYERRVVQRPPPGAEIVNLISPNRQASGRRASPIMLDGSAETDSRGYGPRRDADMHARSPPPYTEYASKPLSRVPAPQEPVPYDPSQPLLPRDESRYPQTPTSEHVRYVPVYRQEPYQGFTQPPGGFVQTAAHHAHPGPPSQNGQYARYAPNGHTIPGQGFYQPTYAPYVPQPVHGAPAPVQQMPAGSPQGTYHPPGAAGYGTAPGGSYPNEAGQRAGYIQATSNHRTFSSDGVRAMPPQWSNVYVHVNYGHVIAQSTPGNVDNLSIQPSLGAGVVNVSDTAVNTDHRSSAIVGVNVGSAHIKPVDYKNNAVYTTQPADVGRSSQPDYQGVERVRRTADQPPRKRMRVVDQSTQPAFGGSG